MVRAEGSALKIVSSMVHAEGGKVARDAGGPYYSMVVSIGYPGHRIVGEEFYVVKSFQGWVAGGWDGPLRLLW